MGAVARARRSQSLQRGGPKKGEELGKGAQRHAPATLAYLSRAPYRAPAASYEHIPAAPSGLLCGRYSSPNSTDYRVIITIGPHPRHKSSSKHTCSSERRLKPTSKSGCDYLALKVLLASDSVP